MEEVQKTKILTIYKGVLFVIYRLYLKFDLLAPSGARLNTRNTLCIISLSVSLHLLYQHYFI